MGKTQIFLFAKSRSGQEYALNYPRFFLNSMYSEKITFLYFKRIQKVLTKTIPRIQMLPNQIPMVKMKIKIVEVS